VTFDYNQGAGTVALIHDGGDQLNSDELSVRESSGSSISVPGGNTFIAGDEIASGDYDNGETIRLVWEDPNSDQTNTIAQSEAPA
jgi:hypothetical protein